MSARIYALAAILALLTACGGGGDQEPDDLVGPPACLAKQGLCT